MRGAEKDKDLASLKETKKSESLKSSNSSSASWSGLSRTGIFSLGVVPNPDREENGPQDAEGMKRSLRQMGICPPRPFDPKKDMNFESWLNRIEFFFDVTKCPFKDKTNSLLLLLDVECFEVAKHLGLKSATNFDEAKAKLKDYFAITETSEELRKWLDSGIRKQAKVLSHLPATSS